VVPDSAISLHTKRSNVAITKSRSTEESHSTPTEVSREKSWCAYWIERDHAKIKPVQSQCTHNRIRCIVKLRTLLICFRILLRARKGTTPRPPIAPAQGRRGARRPKLAPTRTHWGQRARSIWRGAWHCLPTQVLRSKNYELCKRFVPNDPHREVELQSMQE